MLLLRPALAFLLVAVAGVGPAWGNAAAPPPPSRVHGVAVLGDRTPLVVREASLAIDCAAGGPSCALEVVYVIANPSAARAGGTAAFYAIDTEAVTITVDGRDAGRAISDDEARAHDALVEAATGTPYWGGASRPGLSRHGFEVWLEPNTSAQVVVRGSLQLRVRSGYSYFPPGGFARHLYFAPRRNQRRSFALEYLVSPLRSWGAWPDAMSFTLRAPSDWSVSARGVDGVETRREGTTTVRVGRLATSTNVLSVDLDLPSPQSRFVGFFAGIGGHVDNATGLVLRGGAEAVVSDSWMVSLALEVDLDDENRLMAVPLVMAASPWVLIIPSMGVGLGVPVRVVPEVEVGGRVQLDAHLGPLGMVMAIDYFPGMEASPGRYQVTLLGQFSL